MKRFLMICLSVVCLTVVSKAQDYKTAIGVRGGFESGLTIKHFTSQNTAMEFILASRWRGFNATALYEIHNRAFDTDGLRWYYGIGAHLGFWNGDYTYNYWGSRGQTYTVIGIDGILGLEYSFSEAPINIGLDWKPAFNLIGYQGFWADGGALSIRFIF